MFRHTFAALAAAVAVATLASPLLASAAPDGPSGPDLARVRAATARFHDVTVAEAAGYVPAGHCEAGPDGAMGVHYLQPELAGDLELDPTAPEVLLYEPTADGLRLVGVEWWVADAGQDRPEVLGVPLDGPMAGHGPEMPQHYDLHVWVWRNNPDGMTAQWNPQVDCGEEA